MLYIKSYYSKLYGLCIVNSFSGPMTHSFLEELTQLEKTRGIKSTVSILRERAHCLVTSSLKGFKRDKDGHWVGPWRHLERLALRGRRGLRRALRILKLSGYFVHPAPIRRDYQLLKAQLEVTPVRSRWLKLSTDLRSHVMFEFKHDVSYPLSTKRCPLQGGLMLPEVLVSPKEHIESLTEFPNLMVDYYAVFKALVGSDLPSRSFYLQLVGSSEDCAGKISLLAKDRGMKLRPIANCNRVLQLAISPLHNSLWTTMELVPECFVYNQDAGATWVQGMLVNGYVLTSLDLKSASDNIPLDPQLDLAHDLYPWLGNEINIFARVARMYFRTPYKDVSIRYGTGHPMGVSASFGLFTIWLINLFYHMGAHGAFCIVGDDLVFDSSFESELLAYLQLYGVPVNRGKSLFSNSLYCEFVGRVIDVHGSLNVYKASPFTRVDPLGVVRQYGLKGLSLGPSKLFKSDYKDVAQSVLLYQQSPVLQTVVGLILPPRDILAMAGVIPKPVNSGGLSRTIIEKMAEEAYAPVETNGEFSEENFLMSFDPGAIPTPTMEPEPSTFSEEDFLMSGDMGGSQPLDLSVDYLEVASFRAEFSLTKLEPRDAYQCLMENDKVKRLRAWAVESNDEYVQHIHVLLQEMLKDILCEEDGYELILEFEKSMDLLGLEINLKAVDTGRAETEALRGSGSDRSHKHGPKKLHVSSVDFLWRKLKKFVKLAGYH